VGSPYGLSQTVTSGILSAKERVDASGQAHEYLQTDAAINPGNSGGPLVNSQGQVIGINTSIYGESFLGISFAVPSSIARFVFDQIVDHGRVTRGFLGIVPAPVYHDDMIGQGLPDMNGAIIQEVPVGFPAFESGLRRGDVIRRWDGRDIVAYNTLYRYIGMSSPNTQVDVDIIRDGTPRTLKIPVGDAANFPLQ
jgi:serine protease Do